MMKSILTLSILLSATLLSAREMKPIYPDFDHNICLNNRTVNPSAGQTGINKKEALATLAGMKSFDVEKQALFQQLHPAYRAYYNKLAVSIKSDGRALFSYELDRELDLSGSCENVDALLLDIIKNLK